MEVHDRLVRGDIYVHTVVIPEGFTMFDIAQAIQDAGLGSSQDFLEAAQSDRELISDLAPEAKSLEGYLFPNTYQFTRTQSMKDIAAVMVRQFRQVAAQIGLTPNGTTPNGTAPNSLTTIGLIPNGPTPSGQAMDVPKTVTMASIIEKETAAPEERAIVASVYYNRLARKIALQADPSVIYAELLNGNYSEHCTTPTWDFSPLTIRMLIPDSRPDPSGIPAALLSKPPCIPRRPTIFILSATAMAATAFPAASKNTIRMWPNSGGSCRESSVF